MEKFRFLKILGFEAKRILRNKVIFVMLMVFAILTILVLYIVQSATMRYDVAVWEEDGIKLTETEIYDVLCKPLDEVNLSYVSSEEEGVERVKKQEVVFFVHVWKGETGEPRAVIHYDASNRVVALLVSEFSELRIDRSLDSILEFFEEKGITLDVISFSTEQVSYEFTHTQRTFVAELAAFVSLVLLLGVAYSLARDRETGVSQNVAYIPIGHNAYFLSKLIPYFLLGIFEMLVLCVLGAKLMAISFQINLFIVWLLSSFFVMATLSLGLLFSTMRSQISTAFCAMVSILLPMFVYLLVVVSALPVAAQVILNFLPVMPFITMFGTMIYNGVILWWYVPIFLAQTIIYYCLALWVMKKKA